ncbi:MAG: T6SS immunity protein Tdi1 domain-containing protein [Nitrospiraceae bacterium]
MRQFSSTHKLHHQDSTDHSTQPDISMPVQLANLLARERAASYAGGFFRFIEPDLFRRYFAMWNMDPTHCVPFIKCAFGHLVFYHEEQYKALNPVHNCIDVLGEKSELDFVMDILLCDRQALENSFFIDLYEQVSERLGVPQLDEIYAFIPAIGLGGGRSVSHIQKVRMDEEMLILSRL